MESDSYFIEMDEVEHPMPLLHFMKRRECKESEDYDPKEVSLGPYHHGKPNLKFVEDYKPKAVMMFIDETYGTKNEDEYLDEILKHIGYLLGILEILVRLRYDMDRHNFVKKMEEGFFRMFFHLRVAELPEADVSNRLGEEPLHLLELFRRVIVTGHDRDPKSKTDKHLCSTNNLVWFCNKSCCCDDDNLISSEPVFISVTDLKSKGMTFSASGIKSLKGVRFRPYEFLLKSAELKLPRSYVTKDTRVFFKNLIAYEFSPYFPNPSNKPVTAYVNFMRLLVISQEDVKELREKQIIINGLGKDEEVVELYKALDSFGAEDTSYFWYVKRDIEEHYRSKAKTWLAELRIKYYGNPWSMVALSGSIFLVFLDTVQTYYAAHGSGQPSSKGAS